MEPGAHVCRCWKCRPSIYPQQPESEIGVDGKPTPYMRARHPRHRPGPSWATAERMGMQDGRIAVYLNGVNVEEHGWGVMEVLFGEPGWVAYEQLGVPHRVLDRTAPSAHLWTQCQCGSGQACIQVAFGLVTTEAVSEDKVAWRTTTQIAPGVWVMDLASEPRPPVSLDMTWTEI